jgi:2-methylcitrate dehydratase PrpD
MSEHASQRAERTLALAHFVGSFRATKLPRDVAQRTLAMILDGTGALASAANPRFTTGKRIAAFARGQGGKSQASVVGHGFKTGVAHAALANGTMGYASDVEPHHPEGILHPVAVMIPTSLAVGEFVGASGRDFIAAVALGCEIEYRVSIALGPAEQYALGFHPSAVCGAFGATAAAAFLLRLKPEAVVRAFGLAACQASGMMAWESDPTENSRPFQMGMAARNGVTAALLARDGFGGPDSVFDHGHTIFRAFSRNPRPEKLVAELGTRWDGIMELAVKPYSCVSFLHPSLDALIGLVEENDLEIGDVESILLKFPKDGIHCIDGNPLKSHCAQYMLPIAVADRRLKVADIFVDRRKRDPEVARLAKCVRVESDPELDKLFPDFYASIIEITTRDGRRFARRNDIARGYPETPLTQDELLDKFRALAGSVMSDARVAKLQRIVTDLPHAKSLRTYAAALRAKAVAR